MHEGGGMGKASTGQGSSSYVALLENLEAEGSKGVDRGDNRQKQKGQDGGATVGKKPVTKRKG